MRLGIVGIQGAGKTTVFNLLIRNVEIHCDMPLQIPKMSSF